MTCGPRDPVVRSNGYWSQRLHELPHINACLHLSPDNYIHNSKLYESGVRILALIPVVMILILLLLLFIKLYLQMYNVAKGDVATCYCNCSEMNCLKCLVKWALILLLLAILIEFIILCCGLRSLRNHYITDAIIDNFQYGKDLDKQMESDKMAPGEVFDKSYAQEDCKDLQDFKKILKNDSVRPYRKLYARYLTELQGAWYDVARPTIPPRVVRTQFQKDLLQFVVTRFFTCLLGWATCILILVCRPDRYWIVALVGVIWCCVASWILMRAAVKVADICENPDVFVNTFVDHKKLKKQMVQEHYAFCDEYHTYSSRSKPKIRNVYYKWKSIFQKTLDKIRGEYDAGEVTSKEISQEPITKSSDKSAVTDVNKKARNKKFYNFSLVVSHTTDYRYCYLKRVQEFEDQQITKYAGQLNVKYMKCTGKVLEEDMPVDNIDALCQHDAIVKWLLLQLLLVFLLALLFLTMLAIHFSRQSNIFQYKMLLDRFKQKSKKTVKDTTDWILHERRVYPPTLPPGECYKTCKQYKKIERAKKYLAGKLGDEEEPKLKRDPFTKYPLPMTPICARRRYKTCCEPIELVPLKKQDSSICSKETTTTSRPCTDLFETSSYQD